MATPLVAPVQFDDRYGTRAIPSVTEGMASDVVQGAKALVQIDSQKQVSDLTQQSEDLAVAYKFAAKEQEVNRGQSAGVVDGVNLVQAGPYQFDKSTLSSGQLAEYNRLTSDLDRNASLVEQGKLTQTAFFARAEAMTKAAINRRPSLARELSSAAAERLGIDPMQGVRSIINEQNEWAKQQASAAKDSPAAKAQAAIGTIAYQMSGGQPPTQDDWSQASLFYQNQQKLATLEQDSKVVELQDKGVARTAGVQGNVISNIISTVVDMATLRLSTTPEGIAGMVESGAFASGTNALRQTLVGKINDRVSQLRSIGTPDANRLAEIVLKDGMAEVNKQLESFDKIAAGGLSDASSINSLRARQLEQREKAELTLKYGDAIQQDFWSKAGAGLITTDPVFNKAVKEKGATFLNGLLTPTPSAAGAAPSGLQDEGDGSGVGVPIRFNSLEVTTDVEKGKRLANTFAALISSNPTEVATVDISDKKFIGSELLPLFVNLGPGRDIGGRPVLGTAIQATADALKTYRPSVPSVAGENNRKDSIQGQVSLALGYAAKPENVRIAANGSPADREVYKQLGTLGFELVTAEISALNDKQVYGNGAKFVDLMKYTLVRGKTGSHVKVEVDEDKAKSAVVGYNPSDKLALLRTQATFFQGTINQLHNSIATRAAGLGRVGANLGDQTARVLQEKFGISNITVGE